MYDDILYLKAAGNYVTFVLRDGKVRSRSTFAEAVNLVPADRFARVHRSLLVSLKEMDKVGRHQITIAGIQKHR